MYEQISKLRSVDSTTPRQEPTTLSEDLQMNSWGDPAEAEATRKAAFKLVFNTQKAVKGLATRFQAETDLMRALHERQYSEKGQASGRLAAEVATHILKVVTAALNDDAMPDAQHHLAIDSEARAEKETLCLVASCVLTA